MECIGQFGLGLGIIPRAQLIVNSISPYTALRVQEFLVLSSTTLAGKRMWITFPSQRDRSPLRNCMTHLSLERNPPPAIIRGHLRVFDTLFYYFSCCLQRMIT